MTGRTGFQKLLVLVLVGAFVIGAVAIMKLREVNPVSRLTSSVATFGYDESRSGQVISFLDASTASTLHAADPALGKVTKNAFRYMPLYIDGSQLGFGSLQNRRVLLAATQNGLQAIDVDEADVIWSVEVPDQHRIASTPVIDIETGNVYFYTVAGSFETGFRHHVYQVSFEGEILGKHFLDLDRIYASRDLEPSDANLSKHLHCKTAMGLNKRASPAYVYFGCSIQTGHDADSKYGKYKGLSGLLAAFLLDPEGNLSGPEAYRVFFTSAVAQAPFTGFDTGIYNGGGAPTQLPDGSLLVGTGNGPVFLDQGNFGCSVVRLDGRSLEPVLNEDETPAAFSYSEPPFNECWYLNIEYANASIAAVDSGHGLLAAAFTKDGFLDVFDPLNMGPTRTGVIRKRLGYRQTYSQPALIQMGDRVRVISTGKVLVPVDKFTDQLLANLPIRDKLTHVSETACLGWLLTEPDEDSPELSLLYSGPVRDEYTVAVKDDAFYREILTFFTPVFGKENSTWHKEGHWGPYVDVASLGYGIVPGRDYEIPGASLEKLGALGDLFDLGGESRRPSYQPDIWFLRNLDRARECRLVDRPDLTPIYAVSRQPPHFEPKGDTVEAYDFRFEDQALVKAWEFTLPTSDRLLGTHPVISADRSGKKSVVIVLVYSRPDDRAGGSAALLLDGETGVLLFRMPFQGGARFSMPLIFDEKVVIPTQHDGLQIFDVVKSGDRLE